MADERESKKVEDEERGDEIFYGLDFYVLPEGCIAAVVSFTTPRDACRFSTISKIFKSAADSDGVWNHFLPSDYREIIARSDGSVYSVVDSLSKKQLFMHLADTPLLIDGGALSFSLEKSTGKKCITIAARSLTIIWGDTPRYWTWRPEPESRFSEVAELLNVCWLEIKGKVQTSLLSPNTNYAAYLVFKMTREAFGFFSPMDVAVESSGGKVEKGKVFLGSPKKNRLRFPRRQVNFTRVLSSDEEDGAEHNKARSDKWSEIKIGEFSVRADGGGEVDLSVMEVEGGNWKSGLVIEGIEIRPIV